MGSVMPSEKKKYLSGNINQIALSLSGGGVRAVGFHLGTMSMLRRLNLLRNIQIISSVSGGSMLGIGYSLAQQLGRKFQDFFDDFYAFLPEVNILEELLKGMSASKPPSLSGKRDMITAMANLYDEKFFKAFYSEYVDGEELTFEILMDQPGQGHLQEMIFNATEFKTGTAFRFQVSQHRCLVGNGNISLCRKHTSQIRIADIMAASSCIPVGMEPMFFPDDFHWPDDGEWGTGKNKPARPTNQAIREELSKNTDTQEPTFALMDGGVYDNQGITSTLLALNRRNEETVPVTETRECGFALSNVGRGEPVGPEDWANWMSGRVTKKATSHQHVGVNPEDLDLLIISDTPVRKASFFPRVLFSRDGTPEPVEKVEEKGIKAWAKGKIANITVQWINRFSWALFFVLSFTVIIAIGEFFLFRALPEDLLGVIATRILGIFHIGLPLFLIGLNLWVIVWLRRKKTHAIDKLEELIEDWDKDPDTYINKLRIGDLIKMGIVRAGSTAALTAAIFMDRIRGLGYATAFSRDDLKDKILTNEIFAILKNLNSDDDFHTMLTSHKAWPPTDELKDIIGLASSMPTKLWIDQEEGDPLNDLDYLVVCGQATICYNLLDYLWEELREEDGTWIDPNTETLFEHALKEWKKLMADPLCLLMDRKSKSRLPKLRAHATAWQDQKA